MSKTATLMTHTRYDQRAEKSSSRHHVVNWGPSAGLGNQQATSGGGLTTATAAASKQQRGHRLGEGGSDMGRNRRSSSGGARGGGRSTSISTVGVPPVIEKHNQKKEKTEERNDKRGGVKVDMEGNQEGGRRNGHRSDTQHKPGIVDLYKSKGQSYHRMRRAVKIPVPDEKQQQHMFPNKCLVYYDTYNPPPGYSLEELPDSMSQEVNSQEEPVSPAILIAAQQQREKARMQKKAPVRETACEDFVNRIRQTRRGIREIHNPAVRSPLAALEPKQEAIVHEVANVSFPDDENLNDSLMLQISQQVETEVKNDNGSMGKFQDDQTLRDGRKRDINGKNRKLKHHGSTKTSPAPFTSTPLHQEKISIVNEEGTDTPKTARNQGTRSRNKSGKLTYQDADIFETSTNNVELVLSMTEDTYEKQGETPRKLFKLDASPIKSGEFEDDNDDEIFSQVIIPHEEKPTNAVSSKDSDKNGNFDKTTLLLNNSDIDSFLNPDVMDEIGRLEEMGIKSASSASSCSSFVDLSKTDKQKASTAIIPFKVQSETPRTRSRLSRKVRK